MLPRKHRLPLRRELARVKKEGRLWPSPLFGLAVVPQKVTGPSRFGFIISSRVAKKAVDRNKARRLAQAAVAELLLQLPDGLDLVLLAKKPLVVAEFPEVLTALKKVCHQAGLLRRES